MSFILKTGIIAAVSALALGSAAHADTLYSNLASWQTAVGSWTETTTYGSDNANISSFATLGGPTVNMDSTGNVRVIGGSWSSWCCGYTGQVITNSANSVTFTFSSPITDFGFFVEPDPFNVHGITMTDSNNNSLTQLVDGLSGAAFFGFTGGGVSSFTISSDVSFAQGDVFTTSGTAGVPEPAAWAMLLVGFGGIGGALRASRRRQPVAATA
jgi:hypothetical protein